MNIRQSLETEKEQLRKLHLETFGEEEGDSVSTLTIQLLEDPTAQPLLSLIAELNNQILGHVLFTKVSIEGDPAQGGYILAPLAVSQEYQRSGIGKKLIQTGLDKLKEQGAEFVLVLGDPAYYSLLDFHTNHQIKPPYELPYPEAWMAQELKPGVLENISGTVRCADALNEQGYW
ncbi:MAG: GNAT family N-acetyltransferase [Neptuniibacter sp.]